jgi:hypothetical protein
LVDLLLYIVCDELTICLFCCFSSYLQGTLEGRELPPEPWTRLEGMGKWIGLMVPRLCDPVLAVRKAAVECIEQVIVVGLVSF